MDRGLLALLIGVACAVVFGYFVARASAKHEAVRGGVFAAVFHYLGAAGASGVLPVVLANVLLGQGVIRALLSAALFFGVSFIALMVYAALELPARPEDEELSGWTKEDALSSGL